jgi:hypothetical protein
MMHHPRVMRGVALIGLLITGWAVTPGSGHAQVEETGGIGGTGVTGESGRIGGTGIRAPSGEETGGIGGTGVGGQAVPIIGYGPIQRFGSVFVNGREYAISGRTLVSIDGGAAPVAALRIGDIAKVHGVITGPHSGLALRISVRDAIIGRVTAVSDQGSAFTVLGQRVVAATIGKPFADIRRGDTVAVSAQRLSNGNWAAQRVSVLAPSDRFRLEAIVTAVKAGIVAVAGTPISAPPGLAAGLQPGERVAVTGTMTEAGLRAASLTRQSIALGAPGTRVEVQNYFRTTRIGRIVAADGMVATGASPKVNLNGLSSIEIDGRVTAPNTIAIDHIDIDTPVAPDLSEPGTSHAEGATQTESQDPGNDVVEPQTGTETEITPPDDVGAPVEVEPPEVEEPVAPNPDIEHPDISPPHIDAPSPHVDPPEIEVQPDH